VAHSSSSPTDQLVIIPDRVDDLLELSDSIRTSHGIEITDTLRFFIGDHTPHSSSREARKLEVHTNAVVVDALIHLWMTLHVLANVSGAP